MLAKLFCYFIGGNIAEGQFCINKFNTSMLLIAGAIGFALGRL
jgi:hypothetical protein